jgi:N-acetyl-1-D-myo-inositol-2-amino-2-deoxy-alpha-D-glucopyranoside deacetylase
VADVGGAGEHTPREHILFVHAHPDDETIATGGTIATLVGAGSAVTVLTCTRGERGEVVPPELKHLEGDGAALAEVRSAELAAAMRALEVTDQRFLGAPGARIAGGEPRRYLDSGMRWGAQGAEALPDADPASLVSADFGEVVSDIATVIAAVRPTAVMSYDESGGYGHPDHVVAREAALHAALVMRVPFFSIVPPGAEQPGDRVVDVTPMLGVKTDALRAHRTQLTVVGDTIVHSGGQVEPIAAAETFRQFGDEPAPGFDWAALGLAWKALAALLAVTLGAIVGFIATVNHQLTADIFGRPAPAGVIIALLACAALLVGGRLYFGTRVVAACAAVGLLAVVGLLSCQGPGGSVLVPADPIGWTWVIGTAAIAVLVIAWPRPGAATRARTGRATMGRSPAPGKEVDSP